jgi:hypothetical protein
MRLLPETEEDVRMASLLRLVPTSDPEEKRARIETESIFSPSPSTSGSGFGGKLKSLQQTLRNNAEVSPFSTPSSSSSGRSLSSKSLKIGVQRKTAG